LRSGPASGSRPRPRARTPRAAKRAALLTRYVRLDDVPDQTSQLGVEELGHALLVSADTPDKLGRVAITDLLREGLESGVERDLDMLFAQLFLCIA
jgi:hypothetical protein